jgi:hypothetical protein
MLANLALFFVFLGMMVTLVTSQNWPSKTKKKRKGKKSIATTT